MTTTAQPGLGQITGNVLFYSQPEPLSPEMHDKLGVKRMDGPFAFARQGHAIPLTVGEFPLAAVTTSCAMWLRQLGAREGSRARIEAWCGRLFLPLPVLHGERAG